MRCKYPDPRGRKIALDANALDSNEAAVVRFEKLYEEGLIGELVPYGVLNEINHPNTPSQIRHLFSSKIYTIQVQLTPQECKLLHSIESKFQGNAHPGRHAADANHIFQASKYGCLYFITDDPRIPKKSQEMPELKPLQVVTLSDFLDIYDDYEAGRRP